MRHSQPTFAIACVASTASPRAFNFLSFVFFLLRDSHPDFHRTELIGIGIGFRRDCFATSNLSPIDCVANQVLPRLRFAIALS